MTHPNTIGTRWHYPSNLYLLNYGVYEQKVQEDLLDYWAGLKFNAVRFNVWWHEIYPDLDAVRTGGKWAPLDNQIRYAIGKGLKIILTLTLRPGYPNMIFCGEEDRVLNSDGVADANWSGETRISFSSPRFAHAIDWIRQTGERYRKEQNAGHILFLSPLVTRDAEIPYAHDGLEDFNPMFLAEFRAWLKARYESLAGINRAWGSSYATLDEIRPAGPMSAVRGRDWYYFRDLKVRQFLDSCGAALAAIPGVTAPYRMLLDYGNCGDPMAALRGSLSFGFHAECPHVGGLKHNDAHDYIQAYSGSLLGATATRLGKMAFNEWFYHAESKHYPSGDIIGDSVKEIRAHFEQGMNGVSYVGVYEKHKDNVEVILKRLQDEGVWTAPVLTRRPDAPTVEVPLAQALSMWNWMLRERYFDAHYKPEIGQVNLRIYRDDHSPLLHIIPPVAFLA